MQTHFCPEEKTTIAFEHTCNWCGEQEQMKHTHKIAYDYVQALLTQNAGELWIQRAFNTLGSDNQVFSLSDPLRKAYANLVQESIGDHLWDWLDWWIHECDFGGVHREFTIMNKTYNTELLTLYSFLEIVDVELEMMGS